MEDILGNALIYYLFTLDIFFSFFLWENIFQ